MAVLRQIWLYFTEPSPKITEPDQRRQASLLSSFLLGIIVLGTFIEIVTVAWIAREDYTGYRLTMAVIGLFVILYRLSRTEKVELTAALAVILASLAIFGMGWAEPSGVLGGLFDLLILPLWLGSLYLSMRALILLVLLELMTLLAFPVFISTVVLGDVLIGPFSFLMTTSVLLLAMTRHRNRLEQDRRMELTEKEVRSRREAARAGALLRVAERLNVQLDLDTLLQAICVEATLAINTPIAIVALYDPKQDVFHATTGVGLPTDLIKRLSPLARNTQGRKIKEMGYFRGFQDLAQVFHVPDMDMLQALDLRSLAFADMEYESELIGSLVAITLGEDRDFAEDELLLLRGLAQQAAIAIINTRLYKEARHEAVRAQSLLRMAERLNAQLDLDTLLNVICEEATLALDTPVALLSLYDHKEHLFLPVAAVGIALNVHREASPIPGNLYDEATRTFGTVFSLPDLQAFPQSPNFQLFQSLELHAMALATIEYEGETIGSLCAVAQGRERQFTRDELLLLQGLARQAALAIINTRLFKDARRRLERIQALRAIDAAIVSNHDLRQTLDVLLEQITTQLGVDAAVILLMDESCQRLEYGGSLGFHNPRLRTKRLCLGEGVAGRAAQQNKIIHIADLRTDPQTQARALAREGFVSYYAAPLIAQGKVRGVLEIFHRAPLHPDEEWLGFLEALSGQAAIAVDSTSLFADLQRKNEELAQAYDSTIEGWSHALDLRDKETEGHTQRVMELTLELARAFGFSKTDLVHIRRGALLHDIGKMGVPDSILLKEGKLTDEEWEIMRKHPDFAHEMLLPIRYLRPALDIPYCHHERWDGSGYPRGLKGKEIPLTARIFAVVDVWDALTSDRPYRAAWSPEKTLEHIRAGAGSHFDPQVVEAFVKLLNQ